MTRSVSILSILLFLSACGGGPPPLPTLSIEQENAAMVRALERFDTDRDGTITCDDAKLKRERLFAELDKDSNAKLDAGEYRNAKFEDESFRLIELSDVDRDLDLLVSEDEFIAVPDNGYRVLDPNGDCLTTRDEIIQAARVRADQNRIRGTRLGRRGNPNGDDAPTKRDVEEVEEIDDIKGIEK